MLPFGYLARIIRSPCSFARVRFGRMQGSVSVAKVTSAAEHRSRVATNPSLVCLVNTNARTNLLFTHHHSKSCNLGHVRHISYPSVAFVLLPRRLGLLNARTGPSIENAVSTVHPGLARLPRFKGVAAGMHHGWWGGWATVLNASDLRAYSRYGRPVCAVMHARDTACAVATVLLNARHAGLVTGHRERHPAGNNRILAVVVLNRQAVVVRGDVDRPGVVSAWVGWDMRWKEEERRRKQRNKAIRESEGHGI